ncbi:hypothetical protein MBAV_002796 [Candidatus Magnetobacterium bavaricum]|uniref:Uncharacterized protein n=1 Tax=Candidatus Magnetobacterium bavaricum TaxID=29290 RepID=A0A0F3GSP1_9BACT|nr:hypothetical protein MBAV_002796 [Candidatus Magnetobacterium bavaricum]
MPDYAIPNRKKPVNKNSLDTIFPLRLQQPMAITKGSKMVGLKAGCLNRGPSSTAAAACLAPFLPHTMQR